MSRCINCGKRMQNRRDFCGEDCADEYFDKPEEENLEDEEIEDN